MQDTVFNIENNRLNVYTLFHLLLQIGKKKNLTIPRHRGVHQIIIKTIIYRQMYTKIYIQSFNILTIII